MNKYRIAALLLALALLLGLNAFPFGSAAEAAEPFSADGSVIFEKDGLTVTTAGLDLDPTDDDAHPIIWVDIVNTGDRDVSLGVADGCVNGYMADAVLVTFTVEDGVYCGTDYSFDVTVPANSENRCALSYYKRPGVKMDTLGEFSFVFTLAEDVFSWPDYRSEPVTIVTGESVEEDDLASRGTVVWDDDRLLLVLGQQIYDDWFGPQVYVYAENRTGGYLTLTLESAEADGARSDWLYYYDLLAPGRRSANILSFEDEIRERKGFENLTLEPRLKQAETREGLDLAEEEALGAVSVTYPPQRWGEYENGGISFEVRPQYNELITVETHENDPRGLLFTVSETASLEAGGYEGAGWLFSIGTVREEKLHEMLCYDMSGAEAFARDGEGNYYIFYHPTDFRMERSSREEYDSGMAQWSMLNEWASGVKESLRDKNGLDNVSFNNSEIDMYLARAAWMDGVNATLSTTEYGPAAIAGVDGTPWAEFVMGSFFCWADDQEEAPDGEYVVLAFPDEDVRVDFFFAPGGYARVVSGDQERLYQALRLDESVSCAEVMQGWYYAAAEQAGLREPGGNLTPFLGDWVEKEGSGTLSVSPSLAAGKVRITAGRTDGEGLYESWTLVAALTEDGKLRYENGVYSAMEYGEYGESANYVDAWDLSGELTLTDAGELCWLDAHAEGEGLRSYIR